MGKTKIKWADFSFNPWVGCTKVSPACEHCYAEGWAKRTGQPHLWHGDRRRTRAANWRGPIKWNKRISQRLNAWNVFRDTLRVTDTVLIEQGYVKPRRERVFCASLADVFDNQVPTRWRDDLWHLIDQTPNLDWLLLTKRPQNIIKMLPTEAIGAPAWGKGWPNVWLGTTVENQVEANRRIPHLLAVPAAVHFLSCEPLFGTIALGQIDPREGDTRRINATTGEVWYPGCGSISSQIHQGPRIKWVIAGGESGPGARPMHPDWARSLRDQCAAASMPFFFKQFGEFDILGKRVGKKAAGRLLDGIEHNATPGATNDQ